MTRETASEYLMIHAVHTVFDFIRHRDEELKMNPGYDMGIGWIAEVDLWAEFVKFFVDGK